MIVSVSRRTDIPAFYVEWFMQRIKEGFCYVPNPFNPRDISRVDLSPENVDLFVFWTKNPTPLLPYLTELEQRGYSYYFNITANGYHTFLEPNVPDVAEIDKSIGKLCDKIGPDKIFWRYDPIILTNVTNIDFHKRNFELLAKRFANRSQRIIVSIYDSYPFTDRNISKLNKIGVSFSKEENSQELIRPLLRFMSEIANSYNRQIYSCAEATDFTNEGVLPGKCIDEKYIKEFLGIDLRGVKDPGQRRECGCIRSKDIGIYNTCLHRCVYCYASKSYEDVKLNVARHNKNASILIGECSQEEFQGKLF